MPRDKCNSELINPPPQQVTCVLHLPKSALDSLMKDEQTDRQTIRQTDRHGVLPAITPKLQSGSKTPATRNSVLHHTHDY